MRRIGLLLILIISIIGNSRGQTGVTPQEKRENRYQLIVTNYAHWVNVDDRICDAYSIIYVTGDDGVARNTLETRVNTGGTNETKTFSEEKRLIKSEIKSIHAYQYAHDARNTGFGHTSCKSGGDTRDGSQGMNKGCCTQYYYSWSNAGGDINANRVTFYYRLIPLHTLDIGLINGVPNNYLPVDDKVTLYAKEGFASQLYNYQYRLEGSSTWTNIPGNLYTGHELKVSARDLFGADFMQHENKSIQFRVVSCYDSGINDYLSYSDPRQLTIVRSAPHINQTASTPPVCHGESNGQVHIKFDRPLYAKERLYFALKNTNTNTYDITDTLAVDPVSLTATVHGLPAGFYDYRLYGSYRTGTNANDTVNTYTDGIHHTDTITVAERPKIVYTVAQDSVHCHAGADGAIAVNATGGIGQYYAALFAANSSDTLQTKFFSGTTRFENLKKGDYKIYLRDLHNCEPQSPDSIYQRISVKEPDKALQTHNTGYQEPKAFGYSDGIIWSYISGGTGAYDVTWRDSAGAVVKNEILVRPTPASSIRTEVTGIKKGTYYLYVKDRNHGSAVPPVLENYCGCEALDSIFVDEPPKLLVSVDTLHYVTCHGDTDGQLVAHATGGRPNHTTAMPYTYQWYKVTADSTTVLESYTAINDSILTSLPSAHYVICVTDTNHISAYSPVFHFTEPEPLKVRVQVNRNLSCSGETNGEMEVIVTGGTKPYSCFWETGDTTRVVSGLGKGIYSVFVRDGRYADHRKDQAWYTHYCQEEAAGEITSPTGMDISSALTHPACHSYSDGKIELAVTGGVAPYSYLWNDGATTPGRDNLPAGQYSVTVTDANGCVLSENYRLQEPEPLSVHIGNDFTLCKGQSIKINGGIGLSDIRYLWTDGNNGTLSADSVYTVGKAGQYRLQVTNQAGCTADGRIQVSQSDTELTTDFVVASKIPNNTKVNAVNIIRTGYDNIEWILPEEAVVWDETRDRLQFSIPRNGYYTIGMIAQKEDCQDILYKTLEVVDKGDIDWTEEDSEPFLKNFIVYPNPNDGNFRAKVELREAADYSLYLYDTNGILIESKTIHNSAGEETYFNRTTAPAGAYYLRFVSQKTTSALKIMINK
jgi:hypothetical protein